MSCALRHLRRALALSALLALALNVSRPAACADEGWVSLFDGETLAGWRPYNTNSKIGPGWVVEDGVLKKREKVRGGDLISDKEYEDFVFEWEWRIPPRANNGVKYFVRQRGGAALGHEYQMLDDSTTRQAKWKTASFYDVLPPTTNATPRIGEWNQSRLVVRGNEVEHWLNGELVLRYECGSAEVREAVARSKFKDTPGFGEKTRGHLLLTDHQDECWFRNLRIKEGR